MIAGFAVVVAGIAALVAIPIAIYTAVRAINHVLHPGGGVAPLNAALEARLRRVEDAIDAMAQQIEQLRTSDRYVPVERAGPRPLLPPSDDPPTLR